MVTTILINGDEIAARTVPTVECEGSTRVRASSTSWRYLHLLAAAVVNRIYIMAWLGSFGYENTNRRWREQLVGRRWLLVIVHRPNVDRDVRVLHGRDVRVLHIDVDCSSFFVSAVLLSTDGGLFW